MKLTITIMLTEGYSDRSKTELSIDMPCVPDLMEQDFQA